MRREMEKRGGGEERRGGEKGRRGRVDVCVCGMCVHACVHVCMHVCLLDVA